MLHKIRLKYAGLVSDENSKVNESTCVLKHIRNDKILNTFCSRRQPCDILHNVKRMISNAHGPRKSPTNLKSFVN